MNRYLTFPKQKLSRKQKTEQWGKDCIDAALQYVNSYDYTRRSPAYKKQRNYNLYNGVFDKEDLEYVCNPYGLSAEGLEFPANMQYYPVATPIFDLLFGEETKRAFSYVVKAVNPEAISQKQEKLKEAIIEVLKAKLSAALSPEQQQQQAEAQQEPEEVIKYFKYSYKDIREATATQALTYLKYHQEFDQKFLKGWEDALLAGEEIYKVDIIANEPILKRVNPIELHAVLPHNSDIIDDAEIIVEDTWMSVSEVVDTFYDELTPAQISELEDNESGTLSPTDSHFIVPDKLQISEVDTGFTNASIYDASNNISIRFVTWKSKKKVGELIYIDELGIEQSSFVDESYKPSKGEKIKWFWINEYWEGVKIGNDIYLKIQPKKLQFRRMDNISVCKSGYVGTVYNCNNAQSVSLMDRLVPWIYMYIVMWYRTELLIAANQGKIALIDLSLIPDGWEIEKWLYYATAMKFGFVDSFNEGKKGQSAGKLAGNISTQNKTLDLETGNAIQGHISIIQFIEQKIKELSGVTDQRLGSISSSETVGNAKRAVTQSSHITEKWFQIHNWTKKRVLECMVEAAKEAWKNNTKKLQYVLDDLSTTFFSVDGADFNNSEYGVFISNYAKDIEGLEMLKELTQAAMQNDKIMLSSVADIYTSESLADVKSKLIEVEEQIAQRQQQAQDAQSQQVDKQIAFEQQKLQQELEKEYYKIDSDNQTKIQVAEINSFSRNQDQDINDNNVPDQLEIEKLRNQVEFNNKKLELEKRKIDIQEKKVNQDKNKKS
jgi:hypothetical protein